jgi:hypothetical protein
MTDTKKIEKVWIIKYALTEGPYEADAEIEGGMAVVRNAQEPWGVPQYFHGEGKTWCRTPEDAVARCEVIRANKLASLKKQERKLALLDFMKMVGLK